MPKYVMVFDTSRCINCRACVVACQQENQVPYGSYRNWIKVGVDNTPSGRHFQPGNCMHCDNPTCVQACPTGATYKDKVDGIVKVDTELCIGCGSCIRACPYGARFRDPVRHVVDKCNYCPRLRAKGLEPACVAVCPTRVREFGDLDDPDSTVSRLLKERETVKIIAPVDTKPAAFYNPNTKPLDWPVEASTPLPIQMVQSVFSPVFKGVGALTLLGIGAVALKNLATGNGPNSGAHVEED